MDHHHRHCTCLEGDDHWRHHADDVEPAEEPQPARVEPARMKSLSTRVRRGNTTKLRKQGQR